MPQGDVFVSSKKSITGRVTETWRTNYVLFFWRNDNDNEFRRNIYNFLSEIIAWINAENYKRGKPDENPMLPRFSMTSVEKISSTGGIKRMTLDDSRSEYGIMIHCDYQTIYN
jgi:hypothetical protein